MPMYKAPIFSHISPWCSILGCETNQKNIMIRRTFNGSLWCYTLYLDTNYIGTERQSDNQTSPITPSPAFTAALGPWEQSWASWSKAVRVVVVCCCSSCGWGSTGNVPSQIKACCKARAILLNSRHNSYTYLTFFLCGQPFCLRMYVYLSVWS